MSAIAQPDFTREQPAAPRVMAYCHDSVGIGHLRRTLAICERVGRLWPDASFLLATGTPYVQLLTQQTRVDFIKLPALAKEPSGVYRSKYLRLSLEEIMHCREAMLIEATRSYRPDVVLIDKAPLGVCRELVPTLEWLRKNRPRTRVIFGMRDVEDDARATIAQWQQAGVERMLEECFDEIWVYGMPEVFDVVSEYRLSHAIKSKLRYMGYIARPACGHAAPIQSDSESVLVTVGGGTDGESVLEAYLDQAAERISEMGLRSIVVGGPDLPHDAADRLKSRASRIRDVQWVDFESCMSCRMREARLVVSMGGYNTLCELAVQRTPALVIPRVTPRLEQDIRARLWEKLGVVHVLSRSNLSAESLAERVTEMLTGRPSCDPNGLDLNGLERVAERFDDFWSREQDRAVTLHM